MDYNDYIDRIKAITYEIMLGCENFQEFEYIRSISVIILTTLIKDINNDNKTNWVKLFNTLEENVDSNIDPKLVTFMDEYKISLMELFKNLEEAYEEG